MKYLLGIPLRDKLNQFEQNLSQLKNLETVAQYLELDKNHPLMDKAKNILLKFSENLGKLPGKPSTQRAIVAVMGDFPQLRSFVKGVVVNAPSEQEGAKLLREFFHKRSGALNLVRDIFDNNDISAAYFASLLEAAGTPKSLGSDAASAIRLSTDTLLERGMTVADMERLTPFLSESRTTQREFLTKIAASADWSAFDILRAVKTWGAFIPDDSDASDLSRGLTNTVAKFLDKKPTAGQIGAYLRYIRPQSESAAAVIRAALNQPNISPADWLQILTQWGKVDPKDSPVNTLAGSILRKGPAFLANFSGRELLELNAFFQPGSASQMVFFKQAMENPGAKVEDIRKLLDTWKGSSASDNSLLVEMLKAKFPNALDNARSRAATKATASPSPTGICGSLFRKILGR